VSLYYWHKGQIEKFMQRCIEKSIDLYPIAEIIADTGTVYQKYISRSDADVLIEFYLTRPAIAQEYLPLVISRLETRMKAFTEEISRETQEFLKELLGNQ